MSQLILNVFRSTGHVRYVVLREHPLKGPPRESKNISSLLFRKRPRLVQQRDDPLFRLVFIQPHVVRKVDGYLHCFTAFYEKTV